MQKTKCSICGLIDYKQMYNEYEFVKKHLNNKRSIYKMVDLKYKVDFNN